MDEYFQTMYETAERLEAKQPERAAELRFLADMGTQKESAQEEDAALRSEPEGDVGVLFSEMEAQPVDWLWQGRVPLGFLTLLCGSGGTSKSTLLMKLVADTTNGLPMPDGTPGVPGGAVLVNYEDPADMVVLQRLKAAGADLSKVIDLSRVKRKAVNIGDPVETPATFPTDLGLLEAAIKRVGASLVVIDPLMSMLDAKTSAYRNQSMRTVLQQLQDMAMRLGVAIVIVGHFTKGSGKDPLTRIGGSQGIVDFLRSVLVVTEDASNPKLKVLSQVKSNLGPTAMQMRYQRIGDKVYFVDGYQATMAEAKRVQDKTRLRGNILALLEADRSRTWTPTALAQTLDIEFKLVRSACIALIVEQKIRMSAPGQFQALPVLETTVVLPSPQTKVHVADEKTQVLDVATQKTQVIA